MGFIGSAVSAIRSGFRTPWQPVAAKPAHKEVHCRNRRPADFFLLQSVLLSSFPVIGLILSLQRSQQDHRFPFPCVLRQMKKQTGEATRHKPTLIAFMLRTEKFSKSKTGFLQRKHSSVRHLEKDSQATNCITPLGVLEYLLPASSDALRCRIPVRAKSAFRKPQSQPVYGTDTPQDRCHDTAASFCHVLFLVSSLFSIFSFVCTGIRTVNLSVKRTSLIRSFRCTETQDSFYY